jgi:hypothetical protein
MQAVVEHTRFDLGGDAVRMRGTRPAAALNERGHAPGLEGAPHLIEGVAVETHDAAGLGDVAELLGELQQRELASDTLTQSSHS